MFAAVITAMAAAYLFVCLFLLAPRKPGYSHVRNTISEIGESGAPDQRLVALGLFLPVGLSLLIGACILRTSSSAAAALALCIAIGYLGAALFPCDAGSPISGSTRQALHNFAGAVEYIGGGFALMTLSESLGQPFKAAGFIVLGTAIALSISTSNPVRGLLQRAAEVCLFGCAALAAWKVGEAI